MVIPRDVEEVLNRVFPNDVREAALKAAAKYRWTVFDAYLLIAMPGFTLAHQLPRVGGWGEFMLRAVDLISQYRLVVRSSKPAVGLFGSAELFTGDPNIAFKLRDLKLYSLASGFNPLDIESSVGGLVQLLIGVFEARRPDLAMELAKTLRERAYSRLPMVIEDVVSAMGWW